MFRHTRRWIIALAVALLCGVGMTWAMHEKTPPPGVAVIELFTSEGCSSCPPADALLAKLAKEGRDRVYLLAFHVDYWDTPEWRDAFSDSRFSRRQQGYAKVWGSRDVYTPQMTVNGSDGFVGSDEQVARTQIVGLAGRRTQIDPLPPQSRLTPQAFRPKLFSTRPTQSPRSRSHRPGTSRASPPPPPDN